VEGGRGWPDRLGATILAAVEVFLALYIVLYVALTAWAIQTESALGAPLWKLGSGTVLAGLGAAGMIFFWRGAVTPEIAAAWRVVFPCLVLQTVLEAVWDLRHGLTRVDPDGELSVRSARAIMGASFFAGLIALAPYFYINYLVAFG
jgi:hypothetical protein